MESEHLTIILESENRAKIIIAEAEEQSKKFFSDTVSGAKEAFKLKEEQCRKDADNYIENLQKEYEKQLQTFTAVAEETIARTKASLEGHREKMSALIMDFITGKEKI